MPDPVPPFTLTLTPTPEFVLLADKVACRVWEGTTSAGLACRVLVAGVVVPDDGDTAAVDAALTEVKVRYDDPRRN